MCKILVTALFTFAMLFRSGSAQARPAINDPVCQGAVTVDKLVAISVKKGDFGDCPKGLRSPYLCAMYRAGYSQRSLGYAMRHTLADLGDGTCGRVNLQGVLVYQADGSMVEGDKFVDPTRTMSETGLRFGAWKTRVLYIAGGEAELAMCTAELATCRAQSVKPAKAEVRLETFRVPQPACPAAKCPACPKRLKRDETAAPACPSASTPSEGKMLAAELQERTTERDALYAQVSQLLPVTSRVVKCRNAGHLYDPAKAVCVEFSVMRETAVNASVASATAELDQLRAALKNARSCLGKFRFTSDTAGWCDTSR